MKSPSRSSLRVTSSSKAEERVDSKDTYPVYHDFCKLSAAQVEKLRKDDEGKYRGGKKSTFPRALYDLLINADAQGYNDIVAWQSHGRSFVVKDKNRFAKEILPRHFGCQSSFASFQRQLNVYDFLRMTKPGPDRKSYFHELFLRGKEELLPLMPRKRKSTATVRRSLDPSTEPNLYKYPPAMLTNTKTPKAGKTRVRAKKHAKDPAKILSMAKVEPSKVVSSTTSIEGVAANKVLSCQPQALSYNMILPEASPRFGMEWDQHHHPTSPSSSGAPPLLCSMPSWGWNGFIPTTSSWPDPALCSEEEGEEVPMIDEGDMVAFLNEVDLTQLH